MLPGLGAAGIVTVGGVVFFAGMAALCIPICSLSLHFTKRIEVMT